MKDKDGNVIKFESEDDQEMEQDAEVEESKVVEEAPVPKKKKVKKVEGEEESTLDMLKNALNKPAQKKAKKLTETN